LPQIIGQRAIVIGAGIAGLAAARALADSFTQVLVLERDKLIQDAAPRIGVPQGKQPHAYDDPELHRRVVQVMR
jgi:flavin-dependent dehydrogenase